MERGEVFYKSPRKIPIRRSFCDDEIGWKRVSKIELGLIVNCPVRHALHSRDVSETVRAIKVSEMPLTENLFEEICQLSKRFSFLLTRNFPRRNSAGKARAGSRKKFELLFIAHHYFSLCFCAIDT